jgi:hypothetical protein
MKIGDLLMWNDDLDYSNNARTAIFLVTNVNKSSVEFLTSGVSYKSSLKYIEQLFTVIGNLDS